MKRSKFTEEQVIAILRGQEAGAKTADVCRRHGISSATFYAWMAKYGGMAVSDAKRLLALGDENAKLNPDTRLSSQRAATSVRAHAHRWRWLTGWNGWPASVRAHAERWPSGRRRTPGKRVYRQRYRGFESRSLRHLPPRKRSPDPAAAGFFRCFRGLCGRG